MSGPQTEYTAENADRYLQYAPDPWCYAHFWFPTGYTSGEDLPVAVRVPGGGWDAAHSTTYDNIHDPKGIQFDDTDLFHALIVRGWVVAVMEWPPGININAYARFNPVSRWPAIPRAIGRFIQFCKTHATDGHILGTRDATLGQDHTTYLLDGNSAGAIESMWVGLQPDKALKYDARFIQTGGFDPFHYTANHRVRGILNTDGICDFTKFEADTISAAALPRFHPRENSFRSPAFLEVSALQKRQASILDLASIAYEENEHVGLFVNMKDGSAADGQVSPSAGTSGSYLGSGTAVTYTGSLGATPVVGEAVSGATTGTGTLKAHNSDLAILYIERSTQDTFSGAITGGTSGFTTSTYSVEGNNNRLQFLSYEDALDLVDAAGVEGEITDFTHVHEMTAGAQLKRAREGKAPGLDRFYIGNDYVASLGPTTTTPSFQWSGLDYVTEALDWIENDLGIEA